MQGYIDKSITAQDLVNTNLEIVMKHGKPCIRKKQQQKFMTRKEKRSFGETDCEIVRG